MTETNTDTPDRASSGTDGLIPVFNTDIGGTGQAAVDARELHQYLCVKRDFSSWIKRRITEYGFEEGQYYLSITKMGDGCKKDKNNRIIDEKGLVVPIEYHLTLEVAKELAMVEKNAKGRQARRYFIHCEHVLHAQASQTPPELPPKSEAKAWNSYPMWDEMTSIELLIQERSLFLTLLDCGALGDPDQPVAGLQARWRQSRSYFHKLGDDMYAAMYEAVEPNQGGLREKKRAAFAFIRQWRPHRGFRFLEFEDVGG